MKGKYHGNGSLMLLNQNRFPLCAVENASERLLGFIGCHGDHDSSNLDDLDDFVQS
jgi:hypothetical protein